MENITFLSSKFHILAGAPNPTDFLNRRPLSYPGTGSIGRRTSFLISASLDSHGAPRRFPKIVFKKLEMHNFASISSPGSSETSAIGGTPQVPVPPPPSYIGSPLIWIGDGVGLSALLSVVATRVKEYALQQPFKTVTGQAASQNGQFSNFAFPPDSPFPFPFPAASPPTSSDSAPAQFASRPTVPLDVPATQVEATPPTKVINEAETKKERKKPVNVQIRPLAVCLGDDERNNRNKTKHVNRTNAQVRSGPTSPSVRPDTRPEDVGPDRNQSVPTDDQPRAFLGRDRAPSVRPERESGKNLV